MQFITFTSCKEDRKIDEFEMLGGDTDNEDAGVFHLGDEVIFNFDINEDIWRALENTNFQGVRVHKGKMSLQKENEVEYTVSLTFHVDKRSHTIMKDWLSDDRKSLRISDHTIWVKAINAEVEDVFLWIRKDLIPEWVNHSR